ncbi:MAG TPA: hypothetical protein VGX23_24230 [Actinocrinis sp.]|nr:hypothetical protein [Actinocrinis sp.]
MHRQHCPRRHELGHLVRGGQLTGERGRQDRAPVAINALDQQVQVLGRGPLEQVRAQRAAQSRSGRPDPGEQVERAPADLAHVSGDEGTDVARKDAVSGAGGGEGIDGGGSGGDDRGVGGRAGLTGGRMQGVDLPGDGGRV